VNIKTSLHIKKGYLSGFIFPVGEASGRLTPTDHSLWLCIRENGDIKWAKVFISFILLLISLCCIKVHWTKLQY